MQNIEPPDSTSAVSQQMLDFRTHPSQYRHWTLSVRAPIAELVLDVDEQAAVFEGYELKMNSYDIGVDIELYDAIQRLRFEYPHVKTVILRSAKSGSWCAGANIRMLAAAAHSHKVNFCKFTNETRNAMEDASRYSGQRYLAAIDGAAAGGGYELALAADYILLIDDGNAAVSLPEVPVLAVLPGTGGLTRLVDKRRVRRDLADVFCTLEEGVRGKRAVQWRLVDETVARSQFNQRTAELAEQMAVGSDRPDNSAADRGIGLTPLERDCSADALQYSHLGVTIDRQRRHAVLTITGPRAPVPAGLNEVIDQGADFYPLALARELDDALLHLRFNELEIGTLVFKTCGKLNQLLEFDRCLLEYQSNWWVREVMLFIKRTLKRVDHTSRSTLALVEPASCYGGFLAEILFAVDQSYMLDGCFEGDPRPPATICLSESNFENLPMANDLSRLATRFYGEPESLVAARVLLGEALDASAAFEAGLVTYIPDDIDWDEEIRLLLEMRANFSPDALTAMEANLRFAGPETLETKIFARLSAWQNWVFQRNNAVGERGALRRYGSGQRPEFNFERV